MDDLVVFYAARLDEDEQAAREATPGPWRVDSEPLFSGLHRVVTTDYHKDLATGNETGDVVVAGDDVGGTDLKDAEHIARHDPARVLAEVEAKRKLVARYERVLRSKAAHDAAQAELDADLAHQEQTGVWAGVGFPDVRLRALRREEDYLTAMLPVLEGLVKAEAAVHADHKDYREEWKP